MHRRVLAAVAAVAALAIAPSAASAWAPAATAAIHPGVQTFTDGAQCTSNFIFTNGADTYIGQAAHCSGTGSSTDTNGCTSASLPEGTQVQVTGANKPATMVYNSWLTMQALGGDRLRHLPVQRPRAGQARSGRRANVNPSIPHWGGPTGVGAGAAGGRHVLVRQLRAARRHHPASPKQGMILDVSAGGWSHDVYTVSPGIPGDSGSAFLDATGQAMGILSTVAIAPLAGSNGVGNVGKEIAYAQAHGFAGLTLVKGTEPFNSAAL